MDAKEVGRDFVPKVSDYLVSLPYDLKILQEAASDPDLERPAREQAAGVLLHTLNHKEGTGPERFIEDVLQVRLALQIIKTLGGDGAAAFQARFDEAYSSLDQDLALFRQALGDELWLWLVGRTETFTRVMLKGKRAQQYIEDEEALDALYEDGMDFQTDYNVTEVQVHNKLRRPEQIIDILSRRHQEDVKKRQ